MKTRTRVDGTSDAETAVTKSATGRVALDRTQALKHQPFGLEIEMDGLSVDQAADIVRDYFGGEYDHLGRLWRVCKDESVPNGFELVSPPIFYADLFTVQEIFRRLRDAGARRSRTTGLHVHVSARDYSPAQIVSLVNLYASHSQLFLRLLNVYTRRRILYCQSIVRFAKALSNSGGYTFTQLRDLWHQIYGGKIAGGPKDVSRYTELNINSYFARSTIEFRIFGSSNHAGRLRAYVVLALALAAHAKRAPSVIQLQRVKAESLADAQASADALFNILDLDEIEYKNIRLHTIGRLRRLMPVRKRSARTGVAFRTRTGRIYRAAKYDVLLDAMLDDGFFDRADVDSHLREIRDPRNKRKDSWAQVLMLASETDFPKLMITYLESCKLGKLMRRA